jgi:hypothetical protein
MHRIGRRLIVNCGDVDAPYVVIFEKTSRSPEDFGIDQKSLRQCILEDVYLDDGKIVTRSVGYPIDCVGRLDANGYVLYDKCWFTQEEWDEMQALQLVQDNHNLTEEENASAGTLD